MNKQDLLQLAKTIRYDLTAAQSKLTDLTNAIAASKVPDAPRVRCRHCGLSVAGERTLAEHLYITHDGPEPEHWLEAENRSAHEPA